MALKGTGINDRIRLIQKRFKSNIWKSVCLTELCDPTCDASFPSTNIQDGKQLRMLVNVKFCKTSVTIVAQKRLFLFS